MSARWSQASLARLAQLDDRLVEVVEFLRDQRDITIICTYRTPEEQLAAYNKGFSKLKFGKHNALPSQAVDLQPYPVVDATLREDLSYLAGLAVAYGKLRGYRVRWGGDWNGDGSQADNNFDDLFHLEILG